jgi:beta-lactamase regulating signal transducer with metallopeptidase domain
MSLNGPVAEAIGWALLHLLWQGAVVAAILAATLALLERRSANTRYLVSCAALALLLVLGVATAVREYEPPVRATSTPVVSTQSESLPLTAIREIAPSAPIALGTRVLTAARESLPRVVLVWLIGVALLSSRLLMTWLHTQRLARTAARAANDEWHRIVGRLAHAMRLRRAVKLVESAAVEVPAVIGWLRPVVLLPASTLTGLAPKQIEMVLAHELAHIRRHDFMVNLLQAVVETLMFYHPAVWWMSNRVRIERENCCDDLAVAVCGDAIQYARALARLEELRAPEIAMAANGGALLTRIRRIAGTRAESIGHGTRWIAGIAMLTVVAIVIVAPSLPAFAQREEQPKPQAKKASTTVEVQETPVVADVAVESDDDEEVATPAPPVPPVPPAPRVHVMPAPMAVTAPPAPGTPMAMVMPAIAPMPPTPPAQPMQLAMAMAEGFDFDTPQPDGKREADRPLDSAGRLTVDELISLRAVGVTPEFMKTMRETFPGLTVHNVISLRAVGVTPDWLKAMRAAGFEFKSARDAISMKAVGVTPDFVQRLAKAGYTNLSARELKRLAAAGVDENFIRDMEQYRKK